MDDRMPDVHAMNKMSPNIEHTKNWKQIDILAGMKNGTREKTK